MKCLCLLSLTCLVYLTNAKITYYHMDGDVMSDQPGDTYMADDPYAGDDWMQADWNTDWAMLSGRANQPKCVDIPSNMSLCNNIGYHQMRLPNLLEHDTLDEVTSQAKSWNPLLGIRCHPDTKLFLCSLFSPVCLDRPIWPCRSLCESVQNSCESFMGKYGYPWPEMLRCDKFPLDNDLCIGLQNDKKIDDRVCEPCNKPETFEGIVDNFCSAEFALRVKITSAVISEGFLKLLVEGKKKAFKKGDIKKREQYLYVADGESCECSFIDDAVRDNTYMIVMGRRDQGRLVLTFVQPYDKSSKEMRKAMKSIRQDGDSICDSGIQGLEQDENSEDASERRRGGRVSKTRGRTTPEPETENPALPETVPASSGRGRKDRNRNRDRAGKGNSERRRDRQRNAGRERGASRDRGTKSERKNRRRNRDRDQSRPSRVQ